MARPAQFIMFAAGCVFVICCANLAGILLIAFARRAHEFALRLALGSSRWSLLAHTTAESLVLAGAAGLLGAVIAGWLHHLLGAVAPVDLPQLGNVRMNVAVFFFILVVCAAVAVVFSVVPAWIVSRLESNRILSGGHNRGPSQLVWIEVLAGGQVAVVLALLVLSTFAVNRLVSLASVNSGFDSRGVVAAQITLDRRHTASPERQHAFVEQLLRDVQARPELSAAALASHLPPSPANNVLLVLPDGTRIRPASRYVSADYARVLGVAAVEGDATGDRFDATNVLVNRAFVARYLNGRRAVGTQLFFSSELNPGESWTISSVIGDVLESSIIDEAEPTVYQSSLHAGRHPTRFWLMARARHSTGPAVTGVREVVRAADPSVAADFRTLDDYMAQYAARPRFFAVLLMCFTVFTLLLSGAGIATTLNSCVAHRTREIGIRAAVGASRTSLVILVVRRIAVMSTVAAVAGLYFDATLLQFTGSLVVPDVGTHMGWVTYAAPVVTIMLVGFGASLHRSSERSPASRSTRCAASEKPIIN